MAARQHRDPVLRSHPLDEASPSPSLWILLAIVALAIAFAAETAWPQSFTDVTAAAGLGGNYLPGAQDNATGVMVAGVAVGDVDGDGWEDIYWPAGSQQPSRLFINQADGTFVDVAQQAGVALKVQTGGPLFLDYDDDGDLDLFLTTVGNTYSGVALPDGGPQVPTVGSGGAQSQELQPSGLDDYRDYLFRNDGTGSFSEVAQAVGLDRAGRWGSAFGDVDGDGLLDLVSMTWLPGTDVSGAQIFRNQGDGTFRAVTPAAMKAKIMWGFTPRVVDYDFDGDNDLLLACDINSNSLWRNDGGGVLTDISALAGIDTVQNAMGSALGDVDRDGDLDWFVSSIYAVPTLPYEGFGSSGNRMYLGAGDGTFSDFTDGAGVRNGGWGWAAQFADLDHDTDLDLVHTNGYYQTPIEFDLLAQFEADKLRVFMNDGAGVFTESAAAMGIDDPDQGRGLVVFDFDHDGALDILVANRDTGLTLYQGDPAATNGHWLWVELRGAQNHFGVGAKVTASARGMPDQVEILQNGNSFLSAPPLGLWFGTGGVTSVTLDIEWPGGAASQHVVAVDQRVVITQP